jgi:hypothetical protein
MLRSFAETQKSRRLSAEERGPPAQTVLAREVIARCGTRRQPPFLCACPPDSTLDAQKADDAHAE